MRPDDDTLAHLGNHLAEDLGVQADVRFEIAKAEFSRRAGSLVRRFPPVAFALSALALGYLLVSVAVALAIGERLGLWAGIAVVGVAHVLTGFATLYLATPRTLRALPVVEREADDDGHPVVPVRVYHGQRPEAEAQ